MLMIGSKDLSRLIDKLEFIRDRRKFLLTFIMSSKATRSNRMEMRHAIR